MIAALAATGLMRAAPAGAAMAVHMADRAATVPTLAPIIKEIGPTVVNIAVTGHTKARKNPLLTDPYLRRYFDLPRQPTERQFRSVGSGVIIDAKRGLVLTNYHVIEQADRITVGLRDGRKIIAKLVGQDPDADLAVIEIAPARLKAAKIGDSDKMQVGDYVVALGNPFGIGQTVTSGIVSAVGRSGLGIKGYEDFIQTDASINPGNSGGALVNLRGELIGINTAIVDPGGGSVGIGFAIPINTALEIMDQLVKFGHVRRGHLGATVADLTPDLAEAMRLTIRRAAVVTQIAPQSAAAAAGLKPGDVIVAINGKPVSGTGKFNSRIGVLTEGEKIMIDILRGGRAQTIAATLGPRDRPAPVTSEADPRGLGRIDDRLGAALLGTIREGSPNFGRIEGVEILQADRGSAAFKAGIRSGDIITTANNTRVRTLDDFANVLRGKPSVLLLNITRGEGGLILVIR